MPKSQKKVKRYHIELTAVSVVFYGIFLFFLLAWIFVLGIFVGRGFLPESMSTVSDLRTQIRKLQDMVSREEKYDPETNRETEESPELAFYEKLETKKNEVKNNWKSVKKEIIPEKNNVPPETSVIQSTSEKEEPAQEALQERLPSESDFQYTVQVASMGEKVQAENLVKELLNKGYDAYYYAVEVRGKTYYRVRCGYFRDREQALSYSRKLETESGLKGFVSEID